MSAFDPVEFLNSPQSSGFDTRIPLHKPGDWDGYIGSADKDIQVRVVNQNDENGQPVERKILEVQLYTDNEKALGDGAIAPARCRLSVWLETTASGSIDKAPGKNRPLGYLLFATGHQTKDGKEIKPWSKTSLAGVRVKYRVAHKPRKDTGELQADVTMVAAPV